MKKKSNQNFIIATSLILSTLGWITVFIFASNGQDLPLIVDPSNGVITVIGFIMALGGMTLGYFLVKKANKSK